MLTLPGTFTTRYRSRIRSHQYISITRYTLPTQPAIIPLLVRTPSMSSTTAAAASSSQSPQYSFQRPSTTATRALIDSSTNSPSSKSGIATPSDPDAPHATLHRRKTNNYESALADRLHSTVAEQQQQQSQLSDNAVSSPAPADSNAQVKASEPIIHGSLAYRGDNAASSTTSPSQGGPESGRPGLTNVLGRQQSWKMGDQKRANMERMLGRETREGRGYSSSASAV